MHYCIKILFFLIVLIGHAVQPQNLAARYPSRSLHRGLPRTDQRPSLSLSLSLARGLGRVRVRPLLLQNNSEKRSGRKKKDQLEDLSFPVNHKQLAARDVQFSPITRRIKSKLSTAMWACALSFESCVSRS